MLDSRKVKELSDEAREGQPLLTLEAKVDALSETVVERFDAIDRRFSEVDARFDAIDTRFTQVDARLDANDARFTEVDARFDAIDAAFVEQRQYTEFAFERLSKEMRDGFKRVDEMGRGFERLERDMSRGFGRVERKLDQFIDTQSRTNALVERRLAAVESGRERP